MAQQTIVFDVIRTLETQLHHINTALVALREMEGRDVAINGQSASAISSNGSGRRTYVRRVPKRVAATPTLPTPPEPQPPPTPQRRQLTLTARAAISAAMKKRWRKAKRAGKNLQDGGY